MITIWINGTIVKQTPFWREASRWLAVFISRVPAAADRYTIVETGSEEPVPGPDFELEIDYV